MLWGILLVCVGCITSGEKITANGVFQYIILTVVGSKYTGVLWFLQNLLGVYCKTPYLSYGKSANYPYHLLRMIYSFYIYAGTASFGGSHPNAFNFFKYAWIFRSALN